MTVNFTPDFSKDSNYNPSSAFTQVRFGHGAPVLEVELIEMQKIQNHFRKQILRNLYGHRNGLKSGEFFYDKVAHELQYTNLVVLYDGDFFELGTGKVTVTPNQTIFLKQEYKVIDGSTELFKNGNVSAGEKIVNTIVDERVGQETSRRVQAQFTFVMVDGLNVPVPEGQLLFGQVDMERNFKALAEEISVESAVTIEPQAPDANLANYPIGASNFYLDNTPQYNEVGDKISDGAATELGYKFPSVAVYPELNIVTEKFGNGFITQYAYLGNGMIFYRETNGSVFGEWVQIIDSITLGAYQEKVNKQLLDLTMEVAILSNATSSGVDSNIVIETFKTADDIKLVKGKYDAENRRVYLNYTL